MDEEPTPMQRRMYNRMFGAEDKKPWSAEELAELEAERARFRRLCDEWEAEAVQKTDTRHDWSCYMNARVTEYVQKMGADIGHVNYGGKPKPLSPEALKTLTEYFEREEAAGRKRRRPPKKSGGASEA